MKVIRSILRENFRRHIKCELPLEKTSKDRLVPLKNRVPATAKLGKKEMCSQSEKWSLFASTGRRFAIITMTVVCHGRISPPLSAWQRLEEISRLSIPPPHCAVSLAVLREDLITPKLIVSGRNRLPLACSVSVLSSGFPFVTQP